MKRFRYIFLIIGIVLVIIGCNLDSTDNTSILQNSDVRIGVIETRSDEYMSTIHWYDGELNKIAEQDLKYAMLGSSFHNPVYFNDDIYLIPQGLGNRKDSKKVISINKNNFQVSEFPFENIALNDVAASGEYIYTINTLNGNTHILRLNKNDNKTKEVILEEEYISAFTLVKGNIYAFSSNLSTSSPEFRLYIYDDNLELIEEKDITEFGTSQYKFMQDDDYLYGGVMLTKEDSPASTILKISIETNEIESIEIGEIFPNDILNYNDKIIVTNHDLVGYEGTKISVLDKSTEEFESIDLKRKTQFAGILEDNLIIGNQENICIYHIGDEFSLIKEIPIEKDDNSYISHIIIIE